MNTIDISREADDVIDAAAIQGSTTQQQQNNATHITQLTQTLLGGFFKRGNKRQRT